MAVTSQLCERIAGTDYENLGEPAIEAARRLVLDGIAIAIAGTEEEAIHILAAHHREQGGAGQATAIGNGFRLNTVSASALNGAAMHVLDFEPMWSPANHALSTTLAGVLALAEAHGATGREVLTALVKGVEMQGWIRQASGQFEASTTRFHPPGAVGPLGTAVAAGHILKLDPDQLANAVGIAASRAGSLLANAGTMTKSTHCGHASALGLEWRFWPRAASPLTSRCSKLRKAMCQLFTTMASRSRRCSASAARRCVSSSPAMQLRCFRASSEPISASQPGSSYTRIFPVPLPSAVSS